MMNIPRIDRYILRQYISTFLFILGIVLLICLVVDFAEKIDMFLDKKPLLSELAFDYYPNFLFFWGSLLSPICLFLAVIYFTSRMAGRSELIPLLSAGVSFYRLMGTYLLASIMMAGLFFYVKSFMVPNSTATRLEFEYKYLRKRRISSNKDIHKKVAQDTYVYIGYYNERKKEGHTFALERFEDKEIRTKIRAKKIIWVDSTASWRLEKVEQQDFNGKRERIAFFPLVDTSFVLTPDDIFVKEEYAASMTLPNLVRYIELEEMRGSDILNELYIERHRRFSDPFAMIILTLIGFALSSRKRRGGIAIQIGLGLVTCFLYVALLFIGQSLVGTEVPPWAAIWFPNFIFAPIAVALLLRAPK